jgi:hypothetical protein
MAPEVGFEPTTNRLTADRSTTELLRSVVGKDSNHGTGRFKRKLSCRPVPEIACVLGERALKHPRRQPEPGCQSSHLALR